MWLNFTFYYLLFKFRVTTHTECTGNVTHGLYHNYRVNTEPKHIPVISTTSVDTKIIQKHRSRNLNNLIEIPLETPARTANFRSKFAYLPAFLLSNVMSLAPKIDEVRDVIYRANYDFVSLVETWLQGHIHDNVVDIQGYNLIRRDRCERQHGGVCIYIKDTIEFSVLDELFDSLFEVLWINMRPTRLPRGFTNLIVGTVYHPPSAENAAMLNYLSNCLSVMDRVPLIVALLSLVILINLIPHV